MESCYSSPRSLSGLPCSSRKKESVLKIACKVPRTCGPVISVLAPLDPLVLCSRHIGFHAVPYTCCVLHLETFTQIIPSAHDVHPPDTCMATSHTSSSLSANIILSMRLILVILISCLKLQPPCPIHDPCSLPSALNTF